ncbi:MAG: hypothetical protein IPM77_16880 [Crocinitomicaceae bacterium]|nr:hypothetical protein [Crocinitomicaceae bacterium]
MKLVAKTLFGLEEVLSQELKDLGAENIKAANRAVYFEGDKELLYRSNLWLRTAIAILVPVTEFRFKDEKDLYRQFQKSIFQII